LKITDNDGPLPKFISYNQSSNEVNVMATKSKEIGIYELMYCISDGYAKSTCASFKLTVSDPTKVKNIKSALSKTNETTKLK
jgi:hypothetical protein